ncbi:hypothetical protein ATOBIA_N00710 [Atopobiaceae bacterium P1]|uniref:Uncharacterized protein n=1 Tax=Leptogranulimonas caecicola TaxID=2894156 RepID=A0AAU9CZF2_9ACTN|nr:hypothetical protein ATOBIA_N00710 [Atopobiaceae bacterium P1]BDC90200.1 hypothetical protein ATTO_00720 [Leptogranulimonas caecicola]
MHYDIGPAKLALELVRDIAVRVADDIHSLVCHDPVRPPSKKSRPKGRLVYGCQPLKGELSKDLWSTALAAP